MTGGVAAIVLAGGRGSRLGGPTPKQYRRLRGEPLLRTSLRLFAAHAGVDCVQPVVHPEDSEHFNAAAAELNLLPATTGGAMRQDSVRAGLEALLARAPEIVLVHDAARPFASPSLVDRAIAAARASGAAVPGLPVFDTVKRVDAEGRVQETLDRTFLRTVQTPQSFRFAPLLDAHRRATSAGRHDFTDDAALAEWAGMSVSVFDGEQANMKITTEDDLARAAQQDAPTLPDLRVASGFDVHVFGDGDHVMLGGVRIPHDRGLMGHSDADVGLHALTDAVLGCISDGDIGTHFPPSDMRWRGASSDRFLAYAVERVRARGGRINLLDLTILSEAPKIGPHRAAICARIGEIAGIDPSRVAVKATTMERMGFVGRQEGMAAMATATVVLPGIA